MSPSPYDRRSGRFADPVCRDGDELLRKTLARPARRINHVSGQQQKVRLNTDMSAADQIKGIGRVKKSPYDSPLA